jgi:PBSX family phage portal protein
MKIRKKPSKSHVQPIVFNKTGRASARMVSSKIEGGFSEPFMELVKIDKASQALQDPFNASFGGVVAPGKSSVEVIDPIYPYNLLANVSKANSALSQAVEAYVVNIESYGYQLEYAGPQGRENRPAMQAEKVRALAFLDNPAGDKTLTEIREKRRFDIENLGCGYLEIGQDQAGRPTFIDHVPAFSIRKTKKDKEATEYTIPVVLSNGTMSQRQWSKHFRRYVQIGANGQRVFFKEFGDPRSIDPKTGLVNNDLPIEEQATALHCYDIYNVGSIYGAPRWIGALPDMLGLRESELVNLNFFRENAIPAMAILISGGALTDESYDRIVNILEAYRGQEAMHRVLLLEAVADDSVGSVDHSPPAPKIDMKPMTERQNDALFQEYQKEAKRKIRSSMRLPALYTGDSEEYTKATAQSALRVAETQIFAPERRKFDDFINKFILPLLGITNWRYRSLGPSIYDPDTLSTVVDRFGRQGAMTPNVLIQIANKLLDVQIAPIDSEWGDVPFSYTMGMVQNGQQLQEFEELFTAMEEQLAATDPEQTGEGNAADNVSNEDVSSGVGGNRQRANSRRAVRRMVSSMIEEALDRIEDERAANVVNEG